MGTLLCLLILLASVGERDTPTDPALVEQLRARVAVDQAAREAFIKWDRIGVGAKDLTAEQKAEQDRLMASLQQVDVENTAWLKGVVARQGWPTITQVGAQGAKDAWLLVQHADRDPQFQRQCLDAMTRLPQEEVSQASIAYLIDRVFVAEGRRQIYGTQFTLIAGKFEPLPLQDEVHVDRLRALVGLQPLAEYAKQLAEIYGQSQK